MVNAWWLDAWVDGVNVAKAAIRNGLRDYVPLSVATAAELAGLSTGGARTASVGGVPYLYDAADTTSTHSPPAVIVSADGRRYRPAALVGESLIINGDFQVNQRNFAGGALAAGVYGWDRWRGACTATLSGYAVTLSSGFLTQPIEPAAWGVANFASTPITVSVDSPSADLIIYLGSAAGVIAAGAGRRSVTLMPAAGDTGILYLSIGLVSGAATFGRVKASLLPFDTVWTPRATTAELLLCQRYFFKTYAPDVAPGTAGAYGGDLFASTPSTHSYHSVGRCGFPVIMRVSPTCTIYAVGTGVSGKITADGGEVAGAVAHPGRTGASVYVSNVTVSTSVFLSCHLVADAEV